ncbi:MAG: hypothetical protein HQ492_11750 [Woeseiaceae bacterium]|nr:hypothetical protein [Woeseiaceae bacterium]
MPTDINRNLQELLRDPRETLSTEIKNWLEPTNNGHRALVAKACIALANHGGGHLIIGFTTDGDGYREADDRPGRLDAFSTDWVNEIVERYAEPPFHCDVRHIESPSIGGVFPVVTIPGGHRIPIIAKRSGPGERVIRQGPPYIRRPGPRSEPPRSAQEWQDLMRRCLVNGREEMLDQLRMVLAGQSISRLTVPAEDDVLLRWRNYGAERWREVVEGVPPENPASCSHGFCTIGYQIHGEVRPRRGQELIELLRQAKVRHTGWPEWWVPDLQDIAPYPHGDNIECWIARDGEVLRDDPSHADFWRAHPEGRMFLLRGYAEDALDNTEPGSVFSLTTPVWRVGESLLHSSNVAAILAADDDQAEVEILLQWTGLQGRRLSAIGTTRILMDRWQSNQDAIEIRGRFRAADLPDILPEAVQELTLPLYESFAFFRPPTEMFAEELALMRRHQF